jgi:hypothetical protein
VVADYPTPLEIQVHHICMPQVAVVVQDKQALTPI